LAALEAMACGVPPVATRVGGVPELITHGVDGYLEAPGDIAAHTARVVALLADDALRARLSGAARRTAETRFCSSLIIPQYERYYEEVCGRWSAAV
jgi:glycosyltransferase involved in cell wall biosynthesis